MNEVCEWRRLCACVCACVWGWEEQVERTERRSWWRGWGVGGLWASDFPDEIHNVRRCILKRRFLMGPPHEYKFPAATAATTRSELEGQTHLASTRREEAQPFSFFFFFLTSTPIQSQNPTGMTSRRPLWLIHSYFCLTAASVLLLFRVTGPRVYNDRPHQRAPRPERTMLPKRRGRWVRWTCGGKTSLPPATCSQGYFGRFSLVSVCARVCVCASVCV